MKPTQLKRSKSGEGNSGTTPRSSSAAPVDGASAEATAEEVPTASAPKSAQEWYSLGEAGGIEGFDASRCFVLAAESQEEADPSLQARIWDKLGGIPECVYNNEITVSGESVTRTACYSRAVQLDQQPTEAWFWCALARAETQEFEGKEYTKKECFVKAVEADLQSARSWNNLSLEGGGIVQGVEYSEQACCIQALELDPLYYMSWNNLGIDGGGVVNGCEYSEAECYIKCLEICPIDWHAWGNLGSYCDFETVCISGVEYSRKEILCKSLDTGLSEGAVHIWNALAEQGGGTVWGEHFDRNNCWSQSWVCFGLETREDGGNNEEGLSEAECYARAIACNKDNIKAWEELGNAGGGLVSGQNYTAAECKQWAEDLADT